MAFTDTEKFEIRQYLGYPQVYRQANPRLESAIEVVGNDPVAVTKVQALLAKILQLEQFIDQRDVQLSGIKSADNQEVEFFEGTDTVLRNHYRQGNVYCAQLSKLFGVPCLGKFFSQEDYVGDNWKQFGTQSTSVPSASYASFNFNLGSM